MTFTTIYPGWYTGRTIHIHMRVRTYSGTTVLSNFVTQIFFDEEINNAVLATPAYARTTSRDTTNATDNVFRVANQTRMLATTTGNVTSGYNATITVGTAFQVASGAPAINAGGVSNAVSGSAGVTPGSWIGIYGSNFATATRILTDSDLVNNTIPTTLSGVSAQINGKAAYLQYVSPTQLNVLAPADTATGSVAIIVTNSVGSSNSVSTTMSAVLPGLSVLSNYVRAVRYPDGVIVNGTGSTETGYTTTAAIGPGDILALYGTGFGATNSPNAVGLVFTGAYPTTNPVTRNDRWRCGSGTLGRPCWRRAIPDQRYRAGYPWRWRPCRDRKRIRGQQPIDGRKSESIGQREARNAIRAYRAAVRA